MQQNMFGYLFQAITNLLTQNLGLFDAMGQRLFLALATILVAWFGIKVALSGLQEDTFASFASFVLMLSFGYTMVFYYDSPIPGLGSPFHNLITNEAQYLSNQITVTQEQTLTDRLTSFETQLEQPGWTNIIGTIVYTIIIILAAACQAIAFVVVAWGLIALAACVLLGPDLHPLLHCAETRLAVLGLVQSVLAVRFLSGGRFGGGLHCRQSACLLAQCTAAGVRAQHEPIGVVSGPVSDFSCLYLHAHQDSRSHQRHLQRVVRDSGSIRREVLAMNEPKTAKQLYMEQFGEAIVTGNYLKVTVALLALVSRRSCSDESEDDSYLPELQAAGDPHRRIGPRPGGRVRQLRL